MVPVLKEPEGKTKCMTPSSASEAGPTGGGVPVGPPGKLKDALAMKGSFQEAGPRGGGGGGEGKHLGGKLTDSSSGPVLCSLTCFSGPQAPKATQHPHPVPVATSPL